MTNTHEFALVNAKLTGDVPSVFAQLFAPGGLSKVMTRFSPGFTLQPDLGDGYSFI